MDIDEETSSDYEPKVVAKREEERQTGLALYYALKDLEEYPDKISSVLINALDRGSIAQVVRDLNQYLEL